VWVLVFGIGTASAMVIVAAVCSGARRFAWPLRRVKYRRCAW
jgi:hypothetical protein